MEPVTIHLKPNARLVRQKKYPIKLEARKGLEPLIENFIEYFGTKVDCICTSHGNKHPGTEKQTSAFPKQDVKISGHAFGTGGCRIESN